MKKTDSIRQKTSTHKEASANARDLTETRVSSEELFDGVVLHVFRDQISLPDGRPAERELIRHVGAVCIVPLTEDGSVIIERQYRYPIAQPVIEIPAGKLDWPGEDRLEAAKRELREETGYTADRWTDIGLYYGAPAFSDEKITIYLAEGLHRGEQDLDEDEFIDVFEMPLDRLVEMVVAGGIVDGKTQVAILKTAQILKNRGK
ncbi:MAG: NUDIX hydrolase [Firmicutes bacterium]|nr:NUDIX hydrolase [Bacillota bacterium]